MKHPTDGILQRGSYMVSGVAAEILSVLEASTMWAELSSGSDIDTYVAALDTRTPAEERTGIAKRLATEIRRHRRVACWIPWYSALPDQEYRQEFYPAYRDHSVHSLQVCLLGMYLYETVRPLRDALDTWLTARVMDAAYSPRDLFLEWWVLASLWHDSGYPFEATDFIADPGHREGLLGSLNDSLNDSIFADGLRRAGLPTDAQTLRRTYKAGRFYPLDIRSVDQLMAPTNTVVVDDMWRRLGVGQDVGDVCRELDRLTTQAPVGRPPYHDHGLFGAFLLSHLLGETRQFLLSIADAPSALVSGALSAAASEAWMEMEALQPVTVAATEAIAFHNVSFKGLDVAEAAAVAPRGAATMPGLSSEPHLFFLALTDTLQDWDRHHFVPQPVPPDRPAYRPAVRSADMLLQGAGPHIRVSLRGRTDGRDSIARLFEGWLEARDIETLFSPGAEYTIPSALLAGPSATLETETASRRERARLEGVIQRNVGRAREALLNNKRDGVSLAGTAIADVQRQLAEARDILTASDRDHLSAALVTTGLRQVERQAHAFVEVDCRLPLGRVEAEIGEGGFGIVFRVAAEEAASTSYAFKLFHERDLANEEKRRLFRRGYEAMKALPHNNIVRVYEYSEMPVGFFMAYVDGDSLDGRALAELDAQSEHKYLARLGVAATVAETLSYAHARNVLHRDIKPGNVLLDRTRELAPVLTDFDLAYLEGRSTLTRVAYASQTYGAPEQFDERLRGARREKTVDIYSWGALLYFLVTESAPPYNRTLGDDELAHVQRNLDSEVPAYGVGQIVSLVRDATRPSPRDRLQSMDEGIRRLSAVLTMCRVSRTQLSKDAWVAEVRYRVTGRTEGGMEFASKTGATTWRLEQVNSLQKTGRIDLRVACRLNVGPRWENVDYEGFARGMAKRVDRRVTEFSERAGCEARRHGQVGRARDEMSIEIRGISTSPQGADEVGQLLAAIGRMIE